MRNAAGDEEQVRCSMLITTPCVCASTFFDRHALESHGSVGIFPRKQKHAREQLHATTHQAELRIASHATGTSGLRTLF